MFDFEHLLNLEREHRYELQEQARIASATLVAIAGLARSNKPGDVPMIYGHATSAIAAMDLILERRG